MGYSFVVRAFYFVSCPRNRNTVPETVLWCGLSISYPVPETRNPETCPRNRNRETAKPRAFYFVSCPRNPKPIFSGLAWALIFGLAVSTAFTLILIPVVYWMVYRNRPGHGVAIEAEDE